MGRGKDGTEKKCGLRIADCGIRSDIRNSQFVGGHFAIRIPKSEIESKDDRFFDGLDDFLRVINHLEDF